MEKPILNQFAGLLLQQAGLHFTPHNLQELEAGIKATQTEHGVTHPGELLAAMTGKDGKRFFDTLVRAVTVGETYFLRYPEQFQVLRQDIFPELIARRRQQKDLYLRLWSAGCASGEEAYSLALVLREMLADFEHWNIEILATDINSDSLRKVETGEYGAWSFRGVSEETIGRHFLPAGAQRFRIRPELQKTVHARYMNLRDECYPSLLTATTAMDFIFCRNVLIYFAEQASQHVIDRLYLSLVDGGHLMVGPVEPNENLFKRFHSRFHKGTMIYQRPDVFGAAEVEQAPKEIRTARPPPKVSVKLELVPRRKNSEAIADDPVALLQLGQAAWRDGHLEVARSHLERALQLDSKLGEALFLAALIDADRGHFDDAAELVLHCVAVLPLDVRVHHLTAIIATERGNDALAVTHYKKAVFLDRHFTLGHFGLAVALRRVGQAQECAKYLKNTLALLDNCSDDATLPGVEDIAAGWLKKVARKYLAELDAKTKDTPTWARRS